MLGSRHKIYLLMVGLALLKHVSRVLRGVRSDLLVGSVAGAKASVQIFGRA